MVAAGVMSLPARGGEQVALDQESPCEDRPRSPLRLQSGVVVPVGQLYDELEAALSLC